MTDQNELDAKALAMLSELKGMEQDLQKEAAKLRELADALSDPVHWRIKGEAPLGYGRKSVQNIQLPDLKILGDKVHEYQKKHYDLSMQLPKLSPYVRETIERNLPSL